MSSPQPPEEEKEEPLPASNPYIWTSALADFNNDNDATDKNDPGNLDFSAFEPCYIACIKDLEWQLFRQIQALKPLGVDHPSVAEEMRPLLVQYSELIDAFQKVLAVPEVLDKMHVTPNQFISRFAGSHRALATKTPDRVRTSLANNILLILLNYIYKWDVATNLARRFGNLTTTLGRLAVGVVGGASLLVPMIIMTFVTAVRWRLVIVSLATIGFALGIALTRASKEGVVGATAAYAAVMVVYVGSASTIQGGGGGS